MITLAQVAERAGDDVRRTVIDDLLRQAPVLDTIPFDDAAAPTGGGAHNYTYTRLATPATGGFRALGDSYTDSEATTEQDTVTCKPVGSSYKIDRRLASEKEITFQTEQATKAARHAIANAIYNGDSATDPKQFDGLKAILTQAAFAGQVVDASTVDARPSVLVSLAAAQPVMNVLDDAGSRLDSKEGVWIMTNRSGVLALRAAARAAGVYDRATTANGVGVESYDGMPFVDMGDQPGTTSPIIPVDGVAGTTDIVFVRWALDGVCGVASANAQTDLLEVRVPNFDTDADEVKRGGVEAYMALAVKSVRAVAVVKGIKVK